MEKTRVTIHTSLTPELAKDWQELWQKSQYANVFNSLEWFYTCLQAYSLKEFKILALYQEEKPVAIIPVIKSRQFGISVLKNPGDKFFTEKSGLLTNSMEPKIICTLIERLLSEGNIYLYEVEESLVEALSKKYPGLLASVSSINPFLKLGEDPLRFLSKKSKSKIKNKIEKISPFITFKQHRNNLKKHLATIFEIESQSQKKLKKKDIFSTPATRTLFQAIIKHCEKFVAIDMLYFKNVPVVYNFGFSFKDKYMTFHTAYLAEYRKLNPGKILLWKLTNKISRDGMNTLDFLRGHNMLKEEFTPEYSLQYDIYYSKNSLVRFWWKAINIARRVKAVLIRRKFSRDGDFLFRQYNPHRKDAIGKKAFYI